MWTSVVLSRASTVEQKHAAAAAVADDSYGRRGVIRAASAQPAVRRRCERADRGSGRPQGVPRGAGLAARPGPQSSESAVP
jgi:hypothetical protein